MSTSSPNTSNASKKPSVARTSRHGGKKKDPKTGEVIWTEELEACVFEALQKIDNEKDCSSGSRCKYISNYIQRKTGVLRTPHQISSWLQQASREAEGDAVELLKKDTPSPAPDQTQRHQSPFINFGIQNYSPTMETRALNYGAPLQEGTQSTQVATWPLRYPFASSDMEGTSHQYNNDVDACPQPGIDFNNANCVAGLTIRNFADEYPHGYDALAPTEQGMYSPSYGGYPQLPSLEPADPFCAGQNAYDRSYQSPEGISYPFYNIPSASLNNEQKDY